MPKQTKQPSNRREVLRYGRKLGGEVKEDGRHTKIYNPDTGVHVSVPRHSDLRSGTLNSIVKSLRLMFLVVCALVVPVGLTIWTAVALWSMYGG